MGTDDKVANKGEGGLGKAKEKLGDATDNRDLQAEGKGTRARPTSSRPARRSRTRSRLSSQVVEPSRRLAQPRVKLNSAVP